MRLLRPILGGLLIGALAGLVWFLVILIMPSNAPDNADAPVLTSSFCSSLRSS